MELKWSVESKVKKLMGSFVLKLNIYKTITLGNLEQESKTSIYLVYFIKDRSASPWEWAIYY